MTDIEKQKAAALCDYCQTPVNTSACPRCSKPSPRVSDSEVDAAIEMCSREEIYHTIKNTLGDRFLKPFMTLKLYAKKCAAQHPQREEWRNATEAEIMPALMQHIGEERAILVLSAILTSGIKLVKRELPSPPKAEK